jgi:TrmH RNA methyltransferase
MSSSSGHSPDHGETPRSAKPPRESAGARRGPARDELKICGLAAVRARFARDSGSIERLYFDFPTGRKIGVMCRVLAQARKIYRQIEPEELGRVAGTVHHGGIVAVVAPSPLRVPTREDLRAWAARGESMVVLDRIGNAHNLGAIARTAAFFGVPHLVIGDHPEAARPGDAAYRVAEGGLEHVTTWLAPDLPALLRELAAAGYPVVGAIARGAEPLRRREKEPGRGEAGPVALVLGNEERGMSPEVEAGCSRLVTIPGDGRIESLNVSVAAAVLLWEFGAFRRGAITAPSPDTTAGRGSRHPAARRGSHRS